MTNQTLYMQLIPGSTVHIYNVDNLATHEVLGRGVPDGVREFLSLHPTAEIRIPCCGGDCCSETGLTELKWEAYEPRNSQIKEV